MNRVVIKVKSTATPREIELIHHTLRSLVVKFWLIREGRFDDLADYDTTGNPRFEQEAEQAGNSIEIVEEK